MTYKVRYAAEVAGKEKLDTGPSDPDYEAYLADVGPAAVPATSHAPDIENFLNDKERKGWTLVAVIPQTEKKRGPMLVMHKTKKHADE